MLERESNGKTEQPLVHDATNPKATDWSAGAAVKPLPTVGRVTPMAERPREREPAQMHSGTTFTVNLGDFVKLGAALLTAGAIWWSLKSDLRDMRTTMEFQTKIQEERWQGQSASLADLNRKWQLQQYDIGEIKLALAKAGIYGAEVKITGANGGNGR